MTHRTRRFLALSLTFATAIGLSSCGDNRVTAPAAAPSDAASPSLLGWLLGGWGAPKLLGCPSSETQQTSGVIGIDGGTVSLGGTSIVLPALAVLSPTTIELTIPASPYMEIEITANGGEHFNFLRSVLVTIDYSRCTNTPTWQSLSAWYIDSDTKALLERMLSVDNKLTRTVSFSTLHLSGYALAN
jgi:hypothetical protein